MLIKKISLTNFRNFKNCEILFSCDPEKNFTIILGQNTYGKTTLVKSFIWCLYKSNNFNDKILLNKDVADSMPINSEKQVIVVIELEHKDITYIITTKESYFKNNAGNISISQKASSSMHKMINNNFKCIDPTRVDEEIESILQSDLKEYFFFDGETNAIEKIRTKRNLVTAVTNILGLKNIEKLAEYYSDVRKDSVISSLNTELISNDDVMLNGWNNQLDDCLEKHEKKDQEISELKIEKEKLNKDIENLNNKMDENKDIIADQERKKDFKNKIEKSELNKNKYFSSAIKSINIESSFLKILFAYYFNKCNFDKILQQSSFTSEKSYKYITEEAVNDLIKNGKCICGTIIKDGNDAYNHLIHAKEQMEPHDYSKYISDFNGSEKANLFHYSSMFNILKENVDNTLNEIEKIDAYRNDLSTITKRLANHVDVGNIQKDITDKTEQLGYISSKIDSAVSDLVTLDGNIKLLRDNISKNSLDTEANSLTRKYISCAKKIFDLASTRLKNDKIKIKEELEKEVNEIFKSMYHGNREIKIDDEYKATSVITSNNGIDATDMSTGLETVVNYSFVAGLMKLAKQNIKRNIKNALDDPNETTEEYPLIMDAPFSSIDGQHIKNICETLPIYCDQIIMFVMEKDFKYAQESIKNKIGKLYELKQNSETEADVVEVTV